MRFIKEKLPDKNGFMTIVEVGDFEYVNPIEKIEEITVLWYANMEMQSLSLKQEAVKKFQGIPNFADILYRVTLRRAQAFWEKNYAEERALKVPDRLIDLLKCKKKSDQIKLLNGVRLHSGILMALIYRAWEEFGFTYSTYTAEHFPTGHDLRKMPRIANIERGDDVLIIGDTQLSRGQIRAAIKQRTVTIAKVLDCGDNWHSFYYTYKSVNGAETGNIPHIHYISSGWGMSREMVVAEFKKGKYNLPRTPHIPYSRRG